MWYKYSKKNHKLKGKSNRGKSFQKGEIKIMKYYSDITEKVYNTEEELKAAEKEVLDKKEQEEKNKKALAEKNTAVSAKKKELSTEIRKQEDAINEAYKELEEARKKANEILAEARKRANAVVKTASDKLDEETQKRRDLITSWNKEFGPYTVTYTGERAEEEYRRTLHRIKSMFESNPFFSFPSWFSDFGF